MTEEMDVNLVPWDLIRPCKFGGNKIDPDAKARYHCEILVRGDLPLDGLVRFAVADAAVAATLIDMLSPLRLPVPLVLPKLFFTGYPA